MLSSFNSQYILKINKRISDQLTKNRCDYSFYLIYVRILSDFSVWYIEKYSKKTLTSPSYNYTHETLIKYL